MKSEADDRKKGYVVLDQSILHPKSGGQPSDKGKISTNEVVFDVRRVMMMTGVVIHWGRYVQGIPKPGPVQLQVDWNLRYAFMRRHTAAHLCDHCLSTVLGKRVETTDSWVGEDSYIGYCGNAPSAEQLRVAEEMENEMIAKGAKVLSQLVTREEALLLAPDAPNLARLPNGTHLRVITIEGCHGIPCGDTHLKDIREIGSFRFDGTESSTEGFKVKFDVLP